MNKKVEKNLFVFTDPGVDDGIAIMELLGHITENYHVFLFPVAGNCTKEQAFQNAQTLAYNYANVVVVDNVNIETLQVETAVEWSGSDGIGDCLDHQQLGNDRIIPLAQASEIRDWIADRLTDVLVLSPCGVVYDIMSQYEGTGLIEVVVQMGGSYEQLDFGYEFNQSLNPQAFSKTVELLSKEARHYAIMPFEHCEHLMLDFNKRETPLYHLRQTTSKMLLESAKALLYTREQTKDCCLFIYDLYAIMYYLQTQSMIYSKYLTTFPDVIHDIDDVYVNIIEVARYLSKPVGTY